MPVVSSPASRAVFLSYASQDAEAARRICESLRADGVDVWFDQEGGLEHGDEWDAKIRRQIKECVLFIPLISANTQARHEGYFRLEWELAAERAMSIASGVAFILPIIIDATREPDALVPDRFRKVQWTRLPGGVVPLDMHARFLKLWSHRVGLVSHEAKEVARAFPPVGSEDTGGKARATPEVGRRVPAAAWGVAVLAVALAVGGYFWLKRSAEPASIAAQNAGAGTRPPTTEKFAPTPVTSAASDKSLVVLPLENLSPDPENAIFTEGMHTEIISNLQLISDLKVISRGRALAFKGSTLSNAEIAQKLGVANVITGSVRREKDRVRIQLELRRASDDVLLWSLPKGDRDLKDALALQSDVAEQVARVLQARESKGGPAETAQFMTKDPRAYDLFLKARKAYENGEQPSPETIKECEAILAFDPNFMSAANLLSVSHGQLAANVDTDPAERVHHAGEAKRWAEAAARMVPGGAGDGALSYYYSRIEYDGLRGLALAENQVRALPGNGQGHNYVSIALGNLGRRAEGVTALRRAVELDPSNRIPAVQLALALALLRQPDKWRQASASYVAKGGLANSAAMANARFTLFGEIPSSLDKPTARVRVIWLWRGRQFAEVQALTDAELRKEPLNDVARWFYLCLQADACAWQGLSNEATTAAGAALAVAERLQTVPEVGPSEKPGWLAAALVRVGRTDEALSAAKRAVEIASPESQVALRWTREIALAKIYAHGNRPRECVELLAKLLRVPSGQTVPMLRVEPDWDNVREDPGFKALLADPKNSAPL